MALLTALPLYCMCRIVKGKNKKDDGIKINMPVMFELKPNTHHAAKQRRGFLRFLVSRVNNKFKCIYSTVKPREVLAEVLAVNNVLPRIACTTQPLKTLQRNYP